MAENKKYQFLGKPGTIYNFPAARIFGVTTENFNDTIAQQLIAAGKKDLVKEIKTKE